MYPASRPWTKEEDAKLQALIEAGTQKQEIAAVLHRTAGAVVSRAAALGVSMRLVRWDKASAIARVVGAMQA